ncbi:ribosomal protein S18-alanine N-acetyltransferase [Streptacidiphilus sp. NEAU-YB345]|uniref:Ribosomal protein S18-alanine N-acetyltransferase n=2 Tax=Streptacidiphilus fuscans TaxID=2789292 RepID=A0A931B3A9_9ACTN|nr:ribosomal protein S18-alanine N-acetyltransferase [Streptacidiphilus fuscans]
MRWWDIEAVLVLERELFPDDAWSVGMFWSELADARHPGATRWYTVAEQGEGEGAERRIVGYAGLMAIAGEGDVQTIAVAQDQWGTGLGARLLQRLVDQAAEAECHDLLLEVRVDNDRAQRLYERFGFAPVGIRRNYYQPSGVDALVMRRQMTDADAGADVQGSEGTTDDGR